MMMGTSRLEQIGTGTLIGATAIVGLSIVLGDAPGRVLNGLGGLTWFASAAMLAVEGKRRGAPWMQWAAIGAMTASVAFVVRPSDLTLATLGFGASGLLAGAIAKRDPVLWEKLVPAFSLPMHIGTAVLKAAGRSALGTEASIRTEPPPTVAIVPAVMVAAAIAGGWVASRLRSSRRVPTGNAQDMVTER